MSLETFLFIYIGLIIATIICEVTILTHEKGKYLKISYKSLKSICEDYYRKEPDFNKELFSYELDRLYSEYSQEIPTLKKWYPNIVVWLDAIIFRIDCGRRSAINLKQYKDVLKAARDVLEIKNPFNKCDKYQQEILKDIEKIETEGNKLLVQNIIHRTEEEFLRLSGDINKNQRINTISMVISIISILIPILSALINF